MQTFTMLARRTLPTTQAVMPVLAFAASAALTLLVAGGIQAFHLWLGDPSLPGRGAQSRPSNYLQSAYILLAWASGFLLLTPLFTLGASAARLSARRRDDRLATLRLLGASTGRITLYTVAEALIYATVGFFIGFVLYLVLTIPFGMLHFLDTPLGAHNMILPAHLVFACYVGCLVIAALSSLFGLSKVTISPLGVRTRVNAPKAGIVFLIAGLVVLVLGFIGAQLVLEILRASVGDGTFGTAMSVMFVLLILTLIVVFPLVLGITLFTLLRTWRRGRQLLHEEVQQHGIRIESFIPGLMLAPPVRVPGTAVFLTSDRGIVPHALMHNLKHNKVLHERNVFLTVETLTVPYAHRRLKIEQIGEGFHRIVVRFGFMETPDVPLALMQCSDIDDSVCIDPMDTTYFTSRETVVAAARPGMALWRERLFALLHRNAAPASGFFRIPGNRIVELGTHVEI